MLLSRKVVEEIAAAEAYFALAWKRAAQVSSRIDDGVRSLLIRLAIAILVDIAREHIACVAIDKLHIRRFLLPSCASPNKSSGKRTAMTVKRISRELPA
jgi:hypothetical protein